MRVAWIMMAVVLSGVLLSGCSVRNEPDEMHEAFPKHMPESLGHLCQEIRIRLARVEQGEALPTDKTQLADLVAWAPEFAADTDIGEKAWNPIYQLSEQLRLAISKDPNDFSTQRCDQITRLCQVSEDAWRSLDPESRSVRYRDHHHEHEMGEQDRKEEESMNEVSS